jgi:hypothetical protein
VKTIYFMRRRDGIGPIKIGCTKWPRERLYAIQIWSPYKLEVLAACEGDFRDERTIHAAFAAYRMEGEWFAAVPRLLDLVERVERCGSLPQEFRAPPESVKPGWQRNPHQREIVRRVQSGETYQSIATDYGLSRQRVHQIARRAGCAKNGRAA